MKKLWLGVGKNCVPVSSETLFQVVADAGWLKMPTSPENQSQSWHKCTLFWFDILEIWKLQFGWNSAFALQHSSAWLWTSWTSCLCAKSNHTRPQGLGFLNRLEDRLEEQSSTACGRRLCGIRWDWHFCWWPAKSILCEGWLNHQTPSGKTKTSNVTTQDCLQSGTWFIYTNRG